jgi:hypothetical protein
MDEFEGIDLTDEERFLYEAIWDLRECKFNHATEVGDDQDAWEMTELGASRALARIKIVLLSKIAHRLPALNDHCETSIQLHWKYLQESDPKLKA